MQGFALNNISDCYVGSNQASAIYLCSTLIWPTTPPQPHDYSQDYLTIYTTIGGNFGGNIGDITFTNRSTSGTLYYDEGDNNWRLLNGTISTVSPLIRLKGNLIPGAHQDPYFLTDYGIGRLDILSSYDCNICGNIMSLLYGDNFVGQTSLLGYDYVFTRLFYNNSDIINAQNLVLPATTLSDGCYVQLLANNSNLIYAPQLPAQTLNMLSYQRMFANCTSLTTAPDLLASVIPQRCYEGTFDGCTSLNYIKCLATDISAYNCTLNWLNGVSATGTFVKDASMSSWTTGVDGIPSGWTVQNA